MLKNYLSMFIPLVLIISLSGCIQQRKQQNPVKRIQPLTTESADYTQTQDGLTMMVKAYTTQQEAVELLGKHGKRLFKKKKQIYPIQITIKNNTSHNITLDKKNINLTLSEETTTLSKVCRSLDNIDALFMSLGGAIAVGSAISAPAFFTYGLFASMPYINILANPLLILGCSGGLIGGAAVGASIYSLTKNSRSKRSIRRSKNKYLDKVTCKSHSTINTLIFSNAQLFKPIFDVTLHNTHDPTEQDRFTINLSKTMGNLHV